MGFPLGSASRAKHCRLRARLWKVALVAACFVHTSELGEATSAPLPGCGSTQLRPPASRARDAWMRGSLAQAAPPATPSGPTSGCGRGSALSRARCRRCRCNPSSPGDRRARAPGAPGAPLAWKPTRGHRVPSTASSAAALATLDRESCRRGSGHDAGPKAVDRTNLTTSAMTEGHPHLKRAAQETTKFCEIARATKKPPTLGPFAQVPAMLGSVGFAEAMRLEKAARRNAGRLESVRACCKYSACSVLAGGPDNRLAAGSPAIGLATVSHALHARLAMVLVLDASTGKRSNPPLTTGVVEASALAPRQRSRDIAKQTERPVDPPS